MKKIVALTAFVIVAVAVAYSSVNWDAGKETAGTENVTLSNGDQIALTEKEAALSANSGGEKSRFDRPRFVLNELSGCGRSCVEGH